MLENRKVIITGAASGIGKESVRKCLNEGASVILAILINTPCIA